MENRRVAVTSEPTWHSAQVVTDWRGLATIEHDLGRVPAHVEVQPGEQVTPEIARLLELRLVWKTDTTITVTATRRDTWQPLCAMPVGVDWRSS